MAFEFLHQNLVDIYTPSSKEKPLVEYFMMFSACSIIANVWAEKGLEKKKMNSDRGADSWK